MKTLGILLAMAFAVSLMSVAVMAADTAVWHDPARGVTIGVTPTNIGPSGPRDANVEYDRNGQSEEHTFGIPLNSDTTETKTMKDGTKMRLRYDKTYGKWRPEIMLPGWSRFWPLSPKGWAAEISDIEPITPVPVAD